MKKFLLICLMSFLGVQVVVAGEVTDIFEPFQNKTHRKLIKKYGVPGTTSLYHAYIKEKEITNNCEELIGTCDYYLCMEKNNDCGAKGYFLSFGYQYCSKSLKKLAPEMTASGKLWLEETAICLQEQIQDMDTKNMSCKEIKRAAIRGHDKCYSEYNFCSLSFQEIKKIMKMIMPALLKRGVLFEGVQVLENCISRKI